MSNLEKQFVEEKEQLDNLTKAAEEKFLKIYKDQIRPLMLQLHEDVRIGSYIFTRFHEPDEDNGYIGIYEYRGEDKIPWDILTETGLNPDCTEIKHNFIGIHLAGLIAAYSCDNLLIRLKHEVEAQNAMHEFELQNNLREIQQRKKVIEDFLKE